MLGSPARRCRPTRRARSPTSRAATGEPGGDRRRAHAPLWPSEGGSARPRTSRRRRSGGSRQTPPNKDTIAKLGGVDPLSLLVTASREVAGLRLGRARRARGQALENRGQIAKRLVGLLSSRRRARPTARCACSDVSRPARLRGQPDRDRRRGIPPLIGVARRVAGEVQVRRRSRCSAPTDNATTQVLIAKSHGIPPLIRSSLRGRPSRGACCARALAPRVERGEPGRHRRVGRIAPLSGCSPPTTSARPSSRR